MIIDAEGQNGILDPEHIAEVYWQIYLQKRDTWTQEIDLRSGRSPWHPWFWELETFLEIADSIILAPILFRDRFTITELQMSWQNEASNKILILDIILIQRPLVLSFKVGILRRSQILKSLTISFYIQCQKNSEELSSYLPKNNNVGQKRTGLLPWISFFLEDMNIKMRQCSSGFFWP